MGVGSVGIYTLGCKVAQYESEAIGEAFEAAGFALLSAVDVCDVYVINTCTVTAESDRKSRQIIRRAHRKNPSAVIAVCGCYSQRAADEVAAIEGVSIVIGTADKLSLPRRVLMLLEENKTAPEISVSSLEGASFEKMSVKRAPRTRAYVKIEDGCEAKCTYCAICKARGDVRSKLPSDVIAEVEALSAGGSAEVVLTGIETGSYGKDFDTKYTLADLISELDRRQSCRRIRLGSLAPELVGVEFVEGIKNAKILAPHFHLSLQSGSDKILRAMKRRYNVKTAIENIDRIRESIPQAQFTTDLMVGFPGESEEDFLLTVELVRRARLLDAHVFAYSKREGTEAAEFLGQIPENVKKERSKRLISVVKEVRDEQLDEILKSGKKLRCILESFDGKAYAAHSDEFVELRVPAVAGLEGEEVCVYPVSHKNGIMNAEIVREYK